MKIIPNTRDYQRAAANALRKAYGFAPKLSEVVLLETAAHRGIVTEVGFRVGSYGYAWRIGHEVERAECYDGKAVYIHG